MAHESRPIGTVSLTVAGEVNSVPSFVPMHDPGNARVYSTTHAAAHLPIAIHWASIGRAAVVRPRRWDVAMRSLLLRDHLRDQRLDVELERHLLAAGRHERIARAGAGHVVDGADRRQPRAAS